MKRKIILFVIGINIGLLSFGQTYTWTPEFFNANESATLTVSNFNPQTEWGVTDIYLWSWHFQEDGTQINNPTATGNNFGNSPQTALFTNNGDGTYSFDFGIIQDFFNDTDVATIGFLLKSQDGTIQTGDNFKDVGVFQLTLNSPSDDITILNDGEMFIITASTSELSNYELTANGSVINNQNNTNSYSFNATVNVTTDFVLTASEVGTSAMLSENFTVIVIPDVVEEAIPSGLEDGINYSSDNTRATLVVSAPGKEFIQVAGSFNNYSPSTNDIMKRDPSTGKYWLELTGLTPGQVETYQYWVFDTDPIAGSPSLVKTADPYSTLVLSPFDDPFIPSNSFSGLGADQEYEYPQGQEREVTVLQTGQTPYPWQVTNFQKPKKEDLIIYEVLVRDFDVNRNYQDLIDRIDYFKNLNINAIHLMPVMEFEGNESWGYNTSFHMALDKFYGTPDKLKEFIDVCHQNGIAIILDVVLNHAFGRNPMVRMWMDDPDEDGWGGPATDSPYFNQFPTHSFNVGNDFNHQQPLVQEYTRRVIKHWIEEYNIDGFRWDLTKGFTQNCGNGTFDGNFGCTNQYQQDRIDVLREYADYSWSLDETHYVIFEHLGNDNEEQQWANYRLNETVSKGIMMWGKMTDQYNQLTMGYDSDHNINRMGHVSRGFNAPRLLGYPESHDEERLMYKNVTFGNDSNASHNVRDLNTALSRMSALGAVSVTIPGPKMIWHFGDLGMENSIFTCTNGTVNTENDAIPGGCKLDTKPQPQWTENWLADANRNQIYNDWARLHALKINEPVFEGDYTISSGSLTPRIDIFDTSIPTSELRNVIVLANFDLVSRTINTNFPTGGNWFDLMDNTGSTTFSGASVTIAPGQFRIFGNQPATLSNQSVIADNNFEIFPNPTSEVFVANKTLKNVQIFDITGQVVKSFNGDFQKGYDFNVSELSQGIYIIKVSGNDNSSSATKLIIKD
ncbi:MAG: alpha-amylase family glycosyl hydrolase [Bacteroidota bacterium]